MLTVHNFSAGLVTPVLGYLMSCLGGFLGLRCMARALACNRRERLRWLLLAALSIGTTGVWVMNFVAMLGYAIPNQIVHYNVVLTIVSMVIAVIFAGMGLIVASTARRTWSSLALAGILLGIGIAGLHYTGVAAMRLPARMTDNPELVVLSVVIAIAGATVALWAILHLTGAGATLGAALVLGVAVTGTHYTGMAAIHLFRPGPGGGLNLTGGGATAENFLLPVLVGISILAFVMTATLALSPSDAELRADTALMQRIERARAGDLTTQIAAAVPVLPAQRRPGPAISRATQARRLAEQNEPPPDR